METDFSNIKAGTFPAFLGGKPNLVGCLAAGHEGWFRLITGVSESQSSSINGLLFYRGYTNAVGALVYIDYKGSSNTWTITKLAGEWGGTYTLKMKTKDNKLWIQGQGYGGFGFMWINSNSVQVEVIPEKPDSDAVTPY